MTGGLLQMSGIVADLLYEVEQVPAAGEEAIVKSFAIAPGGGFNAMVAAKRAGIQVCYGGSIGSGPFAKTVRAGLNAEDIPFLRSQDLSRDQGCCSVLIDQDGERTFIANNGAEGHVSFEALKQINVSDFEWMLLSGYALHYAGSQAALTSWLQTNNKIHNLVFDLSPIVAAVSSKALSAALERACWISANAREAAILTGISDPDKAAIALAATRPVNGGAVVRNGADGCVVATSEGYETIPGHHVLAIDTNGAGDTHIGSFIARLSQGDDPVRAARYANVAAAISTTKKGPATAPEIWAVTDALHKTTAEQSRLTTQQ